MALKTEVLVFERYAKVLIHLYSKDKTQKLLFNSTFNVSKTPIGYTVSSDPRFEVLCNFQSNDSNLIECAKIKVNNKAEWIPKYFGNKSDTRIQCKDLKDLHDRLDKRAINIFDYNIKLAINNANEIITKLSTQINENQLNWVKKTLKILKDNGAKYSLLQSSLDDLKHYIYYEDKEAQALFKIIFNKFYTKELYEDLRNDIAKIGVFMPKVTEWNNSKASVIIQGYSWWGKDQSFHVNEGLEVSSCQLGKELIQFIEKGGFNYVGNNTFEKEIELMADF